MPLVITGERLDGPGETLSEVAKRSESKWSAAKMAVVNAMTTKVKLSGGESIKVSKRERYQP